MGNAFSTAGNERKLERFSPPAYLNDLSPDNQEKWSQSRISKWMDDEIEGKGGRETPLKQFFNGTKKEYDQSQKGSPITWTAFPKQVELQYGLDEERWRAADSSRHVQDEYLEWSVARDDGTKRVRRVVMTCEGPEYWDFLGEVQPEDVVRLYKELNPAHRSEISEDHLFHEKKYKRRNKWNDSSTTGTIAHLIQQANTLGAEVNIAAQATVLRKDSSGNYITDMDRLIRCSRYGVPTRNSDPQIGSAINTLARQNRIVSIADPVGLYIHEFQEDIFKLDYNGSDGDEEDLRDLPVGTITWPRGNKDQKLGLRIQIEVPKGTVGNDNQELTVADIYDTRRGRYIKYGAQFADYIKMGVTGVLANETVKVDPRPCPWTSPSSAPVGGCRLVN